MVGGSIVGHAAASTVSGRPATTARADGGGAQARRSFATALSADRGSARLGDLLGVGDQRLVLEPPAQVAALGLGQRREQRAGAQGCSALGELGGSCARTFCGQRGGTRSSRRCRALLHGHDAHADLLVAGEDGPLDGGRPAPARKQRDPCTFRQPRRRVGTSWGESPRRPPRRWHRARTRRAREHRGVAQRARRSHRKTAALGHFLHRGEGSAFPRPRTASGRVVAGRDLVELRQLVQDFRREAGRSP